GNAEQVRDHEQRERARVVAVELALPAAEELVDLAVREPPHELLVLLEALRGEQASQERAVSRVPGRIEARQLVVERNPIAVLLDDPADVVALERHRPLGERSRYHVGVRERVGRAVDLEDLLVARDHHHALMRLAPHRPALAPGLVVGVWILIERSGVEEVDGVELGCAHSRCPPTCFDPAMATAIAGAIFWRTTSGLKYSPTYAIRPSRTRNRKR